MVEVDKLITHPRNYNKHPAKQIEMLAKIIKYQGQRSPLVVSKRSGFLVAGHGRLEAVKFLGWEQVAVDYQDFENEAAEHAHMIADNKISELAEPDHLLLEEMILDLGTDFDLELLGMTEQLNQIKELENKSSELDLDSFDNFQHQCPKCNFEWNDNGTT